MSSKGKATFEWINKDASNIASKEHKIKANSHAQSVAWSARKKKSPGKGSSAQIHQSRLLPQHASRRHENQEVGYRNGVVIQSQALGKATNGLRTSSSIYLSDPAYDSTHLLNTKLDPFMQLAGNISHREKDLLHYYLTTIPITVYGTHKTSAYCPVRDRTAVFVQNHNEWLQWVLLSAEVFMLGNKAAMKSVSVLSRRASLYQTIRRAVSDSATQYSDTTIAHITLAATTEDRIGLRSEAQKHLAAAKRLISDRGDGSQRVPITTVMAFIWLGVGPDAFPDSSSLEAAITSTTSALLNFHQQVWGQRGRSAILDQVIVNTEDDPKGLLQTYTQSRRRAFHPQSPLRPFVEAVFKGQSISQLRSHMAVIWLMNKILCDMRDNYEDSIIFLDRLYLLVASADLASLQPLTVLFMIVDCVARIGTYYNRHTQNTTDFIISHRDGDGRIMWWWEAVDVVELLLLLSDETRQRILRALSAELLGPDGYEEELKELRLVHIANEIRLGWMYKGLDRSGANEANFA